MEGVRKGTWGRLDAAMDIASQGKAVGLVERNTKVDGTKCTHCFSYRVEGLEERKPASLHVAHHRRTDP